MSDVKQITNIQWGVVGSVMVGVVGVGLAMYAINRIPSSNSVVQEVKKVANEIT